MTPTEIWPILAGAAAIVFGAGQLVEKVKNTKYIKVETCSAYRALEDQRWNTLKETLEKLDAWVEKQKEN